MSDVPAGPVVVTLDQLVRPEPGGIGTYICGLLDGFAALRAAGEFDRDLMGLVPGTPSGRDLHATTVAGTRLGVRLTTRAWRWRGVGVPRGAAIVHATSTAGPFRGGSPHAVHSVLVHDLLWRSHPDVTTPRGARFHEQRFRQIVSTESVRIFVTSSALREEVIAAGAAGERVHVVRPGVTARRSTTAVESPLVSGPYTLCVGTIQPRKNIERLAVAHAAARATCEELGPLVLVGRRAWGDVHTGGAIELGPLDEDALAPVLAAATVVAYVPVAEGWGFPAVESLAAGRPTVASTTVPSTRDNPEVVTVNPTDVADIERGLLDAVRHSDDERARARRRASVADLTWTQCARDHLAGWS